MSARLLRIYESIVIARPKLTLIIIALLLLFLAAGLPRVKVDASADSLTLENDASLEFHREVTARYQSGDFLVVTYSPKADLFSDEALATLKALRDELKTINGVTSTLSILDVPLLYSPPLTLSEVTSLEEFRTLLTPG